MRINLSRNQKIVIILLFFVVIGLVIFGSIQKNHVSQTEVEKGAPASIELIDPTNKLVNSFTAADFYSVRSAITNYAIEKGGDGYQDSLEVNEVITPFREGNETTIKGKIKIKGTIREIVFVVNLPTDDINPETISVPAENYTKQIGCPECSD